MNKSQSLFLAAIILSGQKPNHPPKVLRSTMYSPIQVETDKAVNAASLEIEIIHITPIPLDFVDLAVNNASLEIIKTIAAKPEATDYATNAASISVQAFFTRNATSSDLAVNNAGVTVNKFNGVYPKADDAATNTASITVVKL